MRLRFGSLKLTLAGIRMVVLAETCLENVLLRHA